MGAEIVFSVLNLLVLIAAVALRKRTLPQHVAFVSGLVLFSSSLFHVCFGEQRVAGVERYSWDWFTDTYEFTVVLTYIILRAVYTVSVEFKRWVYIINELYLLYALLFFWVDDPIVRLYDTAGMVVGGLWCVLHY